MNQAMIESLAIPTWDLPELQYFHQHFLHGSPTDILAREQLIEIILNAKIEAGMLQGAFGEENHKTGPWVRQWNLRPVADCPGASEECRRILPDGHVRTAERCWACRNAYNMAPARVRYRLNRTWSERPDFADWGFWTIRQERMRIVRVPSTGDLYDEPYIDRWAEIAWRLRDYNMIFYGYTRSWWAGYREGNFYLQPAIERFAQMPKVFLGLSLDRNMDPNRLPRIGRVYYMACDDDDLPPPDVPVHRVFRDLPGHEFGSDRTGKRKYSPMEKMGGVTVCPVKNGIKDKDGNPVSWTCSPTGKPGNKGCGACWRCK